MAKRLLIYSSEVSSIAGVSKDERTESGFTRCSPEQTREKKLETIESTKFIYIYRDEAKQLWLKYVFMRGRGIRDGEEREWSWEGGGHMQLQLWFSLPGPVPPSCLRKGYDAYKERTRDKSDRVRERWSVRARKKKKKQRKYRKEKRKGEKKKRGKRSSWRMWNWRKCGRGHASPTSICLVIVYRYNGWNEPSGLASSTLKSVRWHFKTTLKLRTGFARARETEERSGWPLAPERRERETFFALEIYWEIMERGSLPFSHSLSLYIYTYTGRRHRWLSLLSSSLRDGICFEM